jgi:hypothetical protein
LTAFGARPARRLADASLTFAAGFVLILVAAGFIDPGYSQRGEAISALASTESEAGGLMVLGFVFLAGTALTSGLALLRSLRGRAGRSAGVLVTLAGLLTLVCGFARQSCSTLQKSCLDRESTGDVTGAHVLHNLTALVLFALLVIAGFLIASALRRDPRWSHLSRRVRLAAALGAASFIWFGSGAYGDDGGVVQRLLVLVAYGLPLAVALRSSRAT